MNAKILKPMSQEEQEEFFQCIILAASARGDLTESNVDSTIQTISKNIEKIRLAIGTMPFRDMESVEKDILRFMGLNSSVMHPVAPLPQGPSIQQPLNRAERRKTKKKSKKNHVSPSLLQVEHPEDPMELEKAKMAFNITDTHPAFSDHLAKVFQKIIDGTANDDDWTEFEKLNEELNNMIVCRTSN